MPTFVSLLNYSGSIKGGGPERFKQVQEIASQNGGKILSVYGLLGPYDAMSVAEFPDEKAAMKASAQIGNLIGATTLTMAAVGQEDFVKILSEL